ncbi:MAG: hypothetical protein ACXVRZ_01720 [Gaiellaceae bacterium]
MDRRPHYGVSGLPRDWLQVLELREIIETVGHDFARIVHHSYRPKREDDYRYPASSTPATTA